MTHLHFRFWSSWSFALLVVAEVCLCAAPVSAQLTFVSTDSFNNANGAYPNAALVLGSDGNLYGTTSGSYGTIFKVTPDRAITTLYSFTGGSDGAAPRAALVQGSDGNFYGTTVQGGTSNKGTVFKVTPEGMLTTLYSFSDLDSNHENANGATPVAALVLGPDGSFYGTTLHGGSSGDGTVFKMTPAGALTTLATFDGTNGTAPFAALVLGTDGNFYGTTYQGGAGYTTPSTGDGTIFKVTPSGTLTTIVNFTGYSGMYPGAYPEGTLIQGRDGNFYGTTVQGGSSGGGTVFKVTPAGALTTLYSFNYTNGAYPYANLVQGSDGSFYGTTGVDPSGDGTVFKMTPAGALTTLYSFTGGSDGAGPSALVEGNDGNFYGTTYQGGMGGYGTIFGLFGPPTITGFSPASDDIGATVVITGTNFTGTSVVGFNGHHPTSFSVNAAGTQITTTVPSGATTGKIAVIAFGGEAFSSTSFTVIGPPTITSFSPTTGLIGTTVVITGTNLLGTTVVGFNGHHPTSFTVSADGTTLTTTVPSGATTGTVGVITPDGEAFSSTNFTVTPPPTITSFSPTYGYIGETVVITGTNFQGATVVGFNGHHPTSFTVSSDGTTITTTVPNGATTGKIGVITPDGEAFSSTAFIITP